MAQTGGVIRHDLNRPGLLAGFLEITRRNYDRLRGERAAVR